MIGRALTVKQPHAGRIVRGVKRFEIRSQRTNFRGRLAITASASPNDQGPSGCVVGYASLVDCIPYEDHEADFIESHGVPWRPGLWAWVMTDAAPEPRRIPIKGRLGIWHLDDEQKAAIYAEPMVRQTEGGAE